MSAAQFLRSILSFNTKKNATSPSFVYGGGGELYPNLLTAPSSEVLKSEDETNSKNSSTTKNSNFFPLFSLVLSTFLLPFSADVAEAIDSAPNTPSNLIRDHGNLNRVETYHSGDARCLLSGPDVCASVSYNKPGLFTITKQDGSTDKYNITHVTSRGDLTNPSTTATVKVNNAILYGKTSATSYVPHFEYSFSDGIAVVNGQNIDMYFHNAAYNGNLLFERGGFGIPTYYTFDGNYNGDSDSIMKGKAFKGQIRPDANAPVFTFKNGANAVISNFRQFKWDPSWTAYALNLDTGANVNITGDLFFLTGSGYVNVYNNSKLKVTGLFAYRTKPLSVNVYNNSTLEVGHFEAAGNNAVSAWNYVGYNPSGTDPKSGGVNIIFNIDNSTLKGDFAPVQPGRTEGFQPGKTNFTFNFTNRAKFIGKMNNNLVVGDQGNININLKNTQIDDFNYTQTVGAKRTPNFSAADNSTLGFKDNTINYAANIKVTDSTLKDTNDNGGELKITSKNANIGNITTTGDGKITGNFDSSNVGNITSDNKWTDAIKITNTLGKKDLKIGNIDFKGTVKTAKDGLKIDINLDNGAKVGNINAAGAQLNAVFDGASVGDITNTNTDTGTNQTSLTFKNTAGQSIGKIGSDTSKFSGDIKGTFDFTPTTVKNADGTTTTKSLSIGDITSASTAKNDISFVFGGKDAKGNTLGKPTAPINIKGGSKDSSYTFANLGDLSTDPKANKTIADISGIKLGSDAGVGSVNLVGTSVALKNGEKLDKSSIAKLLGTTSSNIDLKSANLVFGNAKLETKPDGTTQIVTNTDDKGNTVYATLTQTGVSHKPGDGYVKGKSSDANIDVPSPDSGFTLKADFVYTPGTFDAKKGETAWTGTLTGATQSADISFANAGTIDAKQLGAESVSDLKIDLSGTTLTGKIGADITTPVLDKSGKVKKDSSGNVVTVTKPQDVTLSVDTSAGSSSKAVSIVGSGKHDITLDFTGNNSKDKFTGAILGGSDDSSLSIKNLDGVKISSSTGGSIVDGLKAAGVTGINNASAAKNADGTLMTLTDAQKKDISIKTEFKLTGTSVDGNIKDNNYSYNLSFDSKPSKDDNGKDIPVAKYSGTSINFSNNSNDQTLSFSGKDSINPTTHQALNIVAGSGDTKLNFDNTGATVVLKDVSSVGADSNLTSSGTSIIGDWKKGGANVSFDDGSKFYGVIGGSGDKDISVSLGENSLYSPTDGVVQAAYSGSLASTDNEGKLTFAPAVVDLSSTGKKELNFKNPGSTLSIKGLSKDNGLDSGNIVADNMSLKGDLYSKLDPSTKASSVKAQLNFDATDGTPTTFTTDHIGVLANGSNITFNGEGSLKALTPYDATTKKGGITTIDLGGSSTGNTNFTLNNTGATVVFSQVEGQKDVKGNFDIRGTNIVLDNGLSAWEGSKVNLVFAKANSNMEQAELKTQDGTLLTSKTDSKGALKPSTDYVDASNLTLKAGTVSLKGKQNNMTFIGDASVLATPSVTKPMELSGNGQATINLVNMGTSLAVTLDKILQAQGVSVDQVATLQTSMITNTTKKSQTEQAIKTYLNKSTMADLLMQSNNAGGKGSVKYTYNLVGTTLGSATILAPKSSDGLNQAQVYVNATFDNRDLTDRDSDASKYYSDSSAIGNSKLEIAKSALNGNLTLDSNVHMNVSFIGKGAIDSNSTIMGGANDSTFTFVDTDLNFGASSSFSNLQMNGKIILDGVSAKGSFSPTGNVQFTSVLSDSKQINGLVFKNYAPTDTKTTTLIDNLQANGNLQGTNANLSEVQSIKDTSFIGTIDASSATTFTFAGTKSNGFTETDSSKSTSLSSSSKNITLNLIDTGVVQVDNINKGQSTTTTDATTNVSTTTLSGNNINLYGHSALSMSKVNNKDTLKIGGGDSVKLTATIDSNNASLWGATDGVLSFDIEGSTPTSSIYNLTFRGDIAYPSLDQSFYTGNIGILNKDSVINFIDAGTLQDSQFDDTLATVNLTRTTLTGDIFFNQGVQDFTNGNSAFKGNVVFKDPNNNVKDIYFNFTGNTKADKVENLASSDHSYYIAGGAGSNFTFINLTDNHLAADSTPLAWQPKNNADSVFNTLGTAGVHFRAANSSDTKKFGSQSVSQTLDPSTTFAFLGSSITGDINTDYSLFLKFYNLDDGKQVATPSFDSKTNIPLEKSAYNGSSITTAGSLKLSLEGAGALGTQQVSLSTGSGPLYVYSTSSNGEVGSIKTTNVTKGSALWINNLGFEGDFITQQDDSAKIMPRNGSIEATFSGNELQNGFVFGSKDGNVTLNLSNLTFNNQPTEKVIIGTGVNNLNFNNAGAVYITTSQSVFDDDPSLTAMVADGTTVDTSKISTTTWGKNSQGVTLADGSSIIARGTSIIGNLYTNKLKGTTINGTKSNGTYLDLSFDAKGGESTQSSYYAGNYIGVGSNRNSANDGYSKLSFYGKGSIKTFDKNGNVTDLSANDTNGGVALDSSKVNLTIASHNINSSSNTSVAPSVTMLNTGGVVSFEQVRQSGLDSRQDLIFYYSLNLKGVSVFGGSFSGGVISPTAPSVNKNEPVKYQMTFASGTGTETTIYDEKGKAYRYLPDAQVGDDYIERSSYGIKDYKDAQADGGYLAPTFTFIGSSSHNFYATDAANTTNNNIATTFWTNMSDTKINFINADYDKFIDFTAFNTEVPQTTSGSGQTSATSGASAKQRGTMNIIGTNIKDADLSKTALTLNITFDQRGSGANFASDDSGKIITTDAYGALSNSIVKVRKSSLTGKLTLGDSLTANLSFLGQTTINNKGVEVTKYSFDITNASITGGTKASTLVMSGIDNIKYTSLSGFGGKSTLVNTSINGNLEDATGTAGSTTGVLQAFFNDKDVSLSKDGQDFIDNYNQNAIDGAKLDISKSHTFNAEVGQTAGSLDLAFIGNSSTGTNFKISTSDNENNRYSFVDYGKIDLSALSKDGTGDIKGQVIWIGNSYQVGKITNSVSGNIDLSQTGSQIKDNTYIAQGGSQDLTFDFGGSATNPDGSKKQIGVIKDAPDIKDDVGNITKKGGATADSTYGVSNLTNSNSTNPKDQAISTNGNSIIDALNQTLNPSGNADKNPFQISTGTIDITNTSIAGDLKQDKSYKDSKGMDKTFDGTISATFDTTAGTKNPSTLSGNIAGDVTKDITFKGEGSQPFTGDKVISGGDKNSKYTFESTGTLDNATINNILNGGLTNSISNVGKATNAGTFDFEGNTNIVANIKDATDNTNAKDQVIKIGKDTTKSPNGVVYNGSIETSSKVDANFGVGSSVKIVNKNENSVYDFSNAAKSSDLVVATIDNSTKAGKVLGFNGSTSLKGAISDSSSTKNSYAFSGGNGKKAGQWILTGDSDVNKLTVTNDKITQEALEAPTLNNPLAIVDLRGESSTSLSSSLNGAIMNGAMLGGARVLRAADVAGGYVPLNLSVTSMNAKNAIFRMGVNLDSGTASTITIGSLSGNNNVTNYLQFYPEVGTTLNAPILVANVGGAISKNYFKGAISKVGLRIYTPEVVGTTVTENAGVIPGSAGGAAPNVKRTQFYLNALTYTNNEKAISTLDQTLSTAYRGFRVETNNLHLRMGELRNIGASQGAWARIMNGMGSDDSNKDFYTTIQAGYDYKFDVLGGVNYVGVTADTSFIYSEGTAGVNSKGNTLGLGIYNTYLMDNGLYVDAITKYLYIHNQFSGSEYSSTQSIGNSAFLLGGEVGYRYKLDGILPFFHIASNPYTTGFYVEPQVELIYGYIGGSNLTTSLTSVTQSSMVNAALEGNNALISRVGAVIGKQIRTNSFTGDIRLGISYVNEINTGGTTVLSDQTPDADIILGTAANNKLALSLGTNIKINEDWRVYADISRTFFGIYNIDYNLNIGGRWNFGKKTSNQARELREAKAQQRKLDAQRVKDQQRLMDKQAKDQNQAIKADKILTISEDNTGCVGCAPESGYYLKIVTLSSKNPDLEKQLKGNSYRIYSFKDSKNQALYSYLAGPYKTQDEINKKKEAIDKITQWATQNNQMTSDVYEVKNDKK